MWNTDETDPAYRDWVKLFEKEFQHQGLSVELHNFYGNMGYTFEMEVRWRIASTVQSLEAKGKKPDIIIGCGDFIYWQLLQNPDSLVTSIPMVCFALKNKTLKPSMYRNLEEWDSPAKSIVEIHDTLNLQKNLDFCAFIESFLPTKRNTNFVPSRRFVTLLDFNQVWVDSLIHEDLRTQMHSLDTAQYLNCMDKTLPHELCVRKNKEGVRSFAVASYKGPESNVAVLYHPLNWIFYREKSMLRFIQTKHDETSRSLSEGPNLGTYYTMTAEDFLISPDCAGGYFVPADSLVRDAVSIAKKVLEGQDHESFGRLYHKPDYFVNWDVLRPYGIDISSMPSYVNVLNTHLADYNPVRAKILWASLVVLFAIVISISLVLSLKSINRHRVNRLLLDKKAKEAIKLQQLLELAIKTSKAMLWDDRYNVDVSGVKINEQWVSRVRNFYYQTKEGMYQLQFPAMIGADKKEHWYELRMRITVEDGNVHRSGFIINVDQIIENQNKAREAHELLMDARVRQGFISAMNHEIRTPLHAVTGFSMELARTDVELTDEELQLYASIIDTNAARLKKIINDILLVTLMNNTTVVAHNTLCSVSSLLTSSVWTEANAQIERRHNTLKIQSGGEEVFVKADISMVIIVMENLIFNASDFSDEGSSIQVGWRETANGAEIFVRDEGPGIDSRYFNTIFERFFKINPFSPGCGLGLYICRSYMEKMGGSIEVQSVLGQGSTFTLKFKR